MNRENQSCIIDAKHLRRSFGDKVAVYDFSMTAKKGEIIGFLGPNGSGKTTVIRMLCGLLMPDSGEGTCLGYDIMNESDKIRKQVGYMTQRFSLYGYLTMLENLKFIARAFKIKNSRKRIEQVVERLGLSQRLNQLADNLSGGWKQRLALAAALLHEPKLLLLDEPTAGVDPGARRDFWKIINDVASEGVTVLVSTHYMDEAERCTRIFYLGYGTLVTQGTIRDIIKEANLSAWQVTGHKEKIDELAEKLLFLKGVEQVTPFGLDLHITGTDRRLLLENLRPYFVDLNYQWKGIDPTLEDVFIHLIAGIQEERF